MKRQREAAFPDPKAVNVYRDYSTGNQRSTIGAEQKRVLGRVYCEDFADNVCDLVLSTAAARLEFTGWAVDDVSAQEFLTDLYVKNQIADFSYDAHYRTIRDGNHAVSLRWTPDAAAKRPQAFAGEDDARPTGGRVTLHHEPWWDGETGMFIAYDGAGLPVYAVKDFFQVMGDPPIPHLRRTVYSADHFERYIREGQGWAPYPLPTDPSGDGQPPGVAAWTKRDGSPLGIPIVLLANNRFGAAPYGVSNLAGGLIGIQDEINDVQRDITAAARLTAFQMVYATGVDAAAAGSMRVGPGELIYANDAAAKIGAIPPGDMAQLIATHAHKLATFMRLARVPLHLITGGDWPSGAALLRAESPLVSMATQMAKAIGPGWSTIGHRATEIANAFGGLALNEDALVTAEFAPPEKLDEGSFQEIQTARVAMMLQLAMIDDPVLLKAAGVLDDVQIAALERDRAVRRKQDLATASIGGFGDHQPVDANGNPINQPAPVDANGTPIASGHPGA